MGIAIKALNCDFSSHNIGNLSKIDIIIPSGDLDTTVTLVAELGGKAISANWSIIQGDSYATIDDNGVLTMTKWSDHTVEVTVKATTDEGASSTALLNISHIWHPTVLEKSDFTFVNTSNIIMIDENGTKCGVRLAPYQVNNGQGSAHINYRAAGLLPNTKYPVFPYSTSIKPYSDSGVTDISEYIQTDYENTLTPIIVPKGCTSLTISGSVGSTYSFGISIADLYYENSGNNWADTGWMSGSFNKTISCSKVNEGLDRNHILCFWLNFKHYNNMEVPADEVSSSVEFTLTFNY